MVSFHPLLSVRSLGVPTDPYTKQSLGRACFICGGAVRDVMSYSSCQISCKTVHLTIIGHFLCPPFYITSRLVSPPLLPCWLERLHLLARSGESDSQTRGAPPGQQSGVVGPEYDLLIGVGAAPNSRNTRNYKSILKQETFTLFYELCPKSQCKGLNVLMALHLSLPGPAQGFFLLKGSVSAPLLLVSPRFVAHDCNRRDTNKDGLNSISHIW